MRCCKEQQGGRLREHLKATLILNSNLDTLSILNSKPTRITSSLLRIISSSGEEPTFRSPSTRGEDGARASISGDFSSFLYVNSYRSSSVFPFLCYKSIFGDRSALEERGAKCFVED